VDACLRWSSACLSSIQKCIWLWRN
jgi:hypothetical protein